jgi:hypothetical protein
MVHVIRKIRGQDLYGIKHINSKKYLSVHPTKKHAKQHLIMMNEGGIRLHPKIIEHYNYLSSFYSKTYLTKLAKDILNYGIKKISYGATELIKIIGIALATALAHYILEQLSLPKELTKEMTQKQINDYLYQIESKRRREMAGI